MRHFEGMQVYENVNPGILALYEGEKRVLDIGCGSGALGSHLKHTNPPAVVHGLDASPEAGKRATERLDRFACLDLDLEPLPDFGTRYDLIVMGDVLEHLKRPDLFLKSAGELLDQGGSMIVSVPNIANYSIRLRLLTGSFAYTDSGILDRSHLRFFTRQTIGDLFTACGYDVIAERYVSRFGAFCRSWSCGLLAVQFIFKVRKKTVLQLEPR